MKTVQRFFRKYLSSAIGILILFLLLNGILIPVIAFSTASQSNKSSLSVSKLAELVTVDGGEIKEDEKVSRMMKEQNAWAMILNDNGKVIWENSMPAELPRSYTLTQVAQFSKWFLKDYPVFVWEHPSGLFVLGYPKSYVEKYNFVIDRNYISAAIIGIIVIAVANMFFVLLLFLRNTRRVEKAVSPILEGIETIAGGENVELAEHGELAEINAKLNKAATQLIRKDTARAEWINGISHDIRTPLSIMLGYAGELEDNNALSEKARVQASMIRKQGERLRKLVADLNLASKLEYSMQPLNKTRISPVELLRQVMSGFLNNGLDEKFDMDLQADPDAEKIVIEGDAVLLERLLENLIQNSITHNKDGCCIAAEITDCGTYCQINVKDTGSGISEPLLELLNSEKALSLTYSNNGEPSHGLGLSLVQQIIKAHKGKVKFENVQPHGLNVTLTLPIIDRV